MKGIQGLLVAIVLGVVGAGLNMYYLAKKGKESTKIDFIITKREIKKGEKIRESDLDTVAIPKNQVGNLRLVALEAFRAGTIRGQLARRDFRKGELITHDDVRPHAPELQLEGNQAYINVPLARDVVSDLITPGRTIVYFQMPPKAGTAKSNREIIGPFEILSVGNRLGSVESMREAKIQQTKPNVMTIRAKFSNKKLGAESSRLIDHLEKTNRKAPVAIFKQRQ